MRNEAIAALEEMYAGVKIELPDNFLSDFIVSFTTNVPPEAIVVLKRDMAAQNKTAMHLLSTALVKFGGDKTLTPVEIKNYLVETFVSLLEAVGLFETDDEKEMVDKRVRLTTVLKNNGLLFVISNYCFFKHYVKNK